MRLLAVLAVAIVGGVVGGATTFWLLGLTRTSEGGTSVAEGASASPRSKAKAPASPEQAPASDDEAERTRWPETTVVPSTVTGEPTAETTTASSGVSAEVAEGPIAQRPRAGARAVSPDLFYTSFLWPLTYRVDASALLHRIRAYYSMVGDLMAQFEIEYRPAGSDSFVQTSGIVRLKRPGMERFDFVSPWGHTVIRLNGTVSDETYSPGPRGGAPERGVIPDPLMLIFMTADLEVLQVTAEILGETKRGELIVQLKGSRIAADKRLFFVVDPTSGAVVSTALIDHAGEARMTFIGTRINVGIPDSRFDL